MVIKPKRRLVQLKLEPPEDLSEEIGTSSDDSIALKHQNRLNWFRFIGGCIMCVVGIFLLSIFCYRYVSLLNGYEKIIEMYTLERDWQIYIIYGLSLAFTAGMIVSVFYAVLGLIKHLH